MDHILVTGGAGYIGSHICVALLSEGYKVIIYDNFSNSSPSVIDRIEKITGQRPIFEYGNITDADNLKTVFLKWKVHTVIHLAGLKAVAESVHKPIQYYQTNVAGTLCLCDAMEEANIYNLIFSSSATVYGPLASTPYDEDMPLGNPETPYGTSKAIAERMLSDICKANIKWSITSFRYFNPIGAHHTGIIGEEPNDTPNNLLPYITNVAIGNLPELIIYGNDYNTPDGTCLRDYIHVMDLAEGHIKVIKNTRKSGYLTYNLGTGKAYSVLEIVEEFEKTNRIKIEKKVSKRRPGDLAACWASTKKADKELNWAARRDLKTMMKDAWHWETNKKNNLDKL